MSQTGGKKKTTKGTSRSSAIQSEVGSRRTGVRRSESGKLEDRKPVNAGSAAEQTGVPNSAAARWTFLTNHAHVLVSLHRDPTVVLREVALQVGITERAVQRIIQDLEEGGFIRREKIGRQNHYHVREDLHLRHPIEAHRTIGDLLRLVMPAK